tara:strand:- start:2850 stop:4058 length:1209 start_codon:yes stop_codon:yes gene_type:complete
MTRDQMLADYRSKALRGAQDQTALTGLNEKYDRYTAQRDRAVPVPQTGRLGFGAVLSNLVGSGMAKNELEQLEPQRAAAMGRVNEAKSSLPLYNAMAANEQATFNRSEIARNTALDQTMRREDAATSEQTRQDALTAMGSPLTYANPDGTGIVNVYATDKGTVDINGDTVDLGGKVKYEDPRATSGGKGGKGSLTQSQLQTGLGKLRAEVNPLYPIVQGVNRLNGMLRDLPNSNESIPGIGVIEGGSGSFGNAIRLMKGGEAQKIHAAWTQTLAPLIREQAGLAQTKVELTRVEEVYGANWLNDEKVFRAQYPEIMKALKADLGTIEGTFLPEVKEYYKGTMQANGADTIFDASQFTDPFATKEEQANEGAPILPPAGIDADEWNTYSRSQQQKYNEMFGSD